MEPLTPEDPDRIGPYRLLARLGEGGMGQVYLARSDRGRTVAVKTIRSVLAQEPDFRRRFAQEITAAQRVGGQWTAPVLEADTEAATPWVATGYIAGPSLHQVVSQDHGPLPEHSVLLLAGGLAQALRAIHDAGLVHRDLKPSNVMLTIDGPRVIDFGIARALEAAPGEGLTRTGATVGSPGFMSPEQVRGQRLTPASDVFCLGSLLAFAATGRTPFGALDSGVHVLMFRIAEELPELTGVPDGLRQLISACLAKDPAQRPQVADLQRYPTPGGAGGGNGGEPWLPGALVAQLGRHAVSLLDSESPESRTNTPVVPAPPSYPSQPSYASPPSTPSPAPYPQPPTAPHPGPQAAPQPATPATAGVPGGFGPSPYPSGSPYGASPYGAAAPGTPPPGSPGGSSRRRGVVAAVAAVAVAAVVAAIAIIATSGGGEETASGGTGGGSEGTSGGGADGGGGSQEPATAIDDGYLGSWQGEFGTPGESGWKALWFTIQQGEPGETIGTATVSYEDVLCVYDMEMDSFDGQLDFTEVATSSIPETEVQDTCRDNPTIQTLTLRDGVMRWSSDGQETTLDSVGASPESLVPAALVGNWHDEYVNQQGEDSLDVVTIEQGAIGDSVLRWSWQSGDVTCVTENHLAGVDADDRLVLGPDILVEAESDDSCNARGTFWAWVEADGTLYFLLASEPDEDPYPIVND